MTLLTDFISTETWITSDQHWGQDPRRDVVMRDKWIDRVGPDEVVLHLGDLLTLSRALSTTGFYLPGRKYLILGNMDKLEPEQYEEVGFEVLGRGDEPFYWGQSEGAPELIAFSHEPLKPSDWPFDVNVHGHTHENDPYGWYEPAVRANACVHVNGWAPVRLRHLLKDKRVTGT